jgi:hypothetical protein
MTIPSIRARLALGLGLALLVVLPGSALGRSPGGSCPNEASGFVMVTYEEWWLNTVEIGFGGDFELAAATISELIGMDVTVDEAREIVMAGAADLDVNTNGFVCQKRLPATKGHPAYVFNGTDDAAPAH